mgnify:CR=1 FL=1
MLEDVEDEVFSQKILGEGIAVEPTEGKLYDLITETLGP